MAFVYLASASLLCGMMACYLLVRRIGFLLFAERAAGRFVRWERRGRHSFPVVRFATKDGREIEFVGGIGEKRPSTEREHFKVLYPAENPEGAMVANFFPFWAGPLAFFFFSGITAFAAFQQ